MDIVRRLARVALFGPVAVTCRVDAQICFGQGWVGHAGAQAPARANAAMAYDERLGVMVLRGGTMLGTTQYLSDTWVWDRYSWKRTENAGPVADHAMTYDRDRHVVVKHGGRVDGTWGGDTWEWPSVFGTWELRSLEGPVVIHPAMAYDEVRRVTVLYGTMNNAGATWEWNGQTWTDRQSGTPGPRTRHAMTFDRAAGGCVLFGGLGPQGDLADAWRWDGNTWTKLFDAGPSARSEHQLVYDSVTGAPLVIAGSQFYCTSPEGCTKPKLTDTWALRASGWEQLPAALSPGRYAHAAAFDEALGQTVLFSGNTSVVTPDGVTADTRVLPAGGSWTQPDSGGPAPRYGHAMAYDAAHARTVMFGGFNPGTARDTWTWDGHAWTQIPGTGPFTIAPLLAYDSDRRILVLVDGGAGLPANTLSTHEWDGSAWVQHASGGPPARRGYVMYYDPVRRATIIVGGRDAQNTRLTDMWQWDGAAWTLVSSIIPPFGQTNGGFSGAFDEQRGTPVVREFYPVQTWTSGATWEWSGGAWVQREFEARVTMSSTFMVYDSTRRVVVRNALTSPDQECTMFDWSGQAWVARPNTSRAPRSQGAFAYDRARDRIVAFGEVYFSAAPVGGTWEFGSLAPSVEVQPAGTTALPGQRLVLTVGAAGGAPMRYQWRRDGVTLPGAIGAAYVVPSASAADVGDYDVIVSNDCGSAKSDAAPVRLVCPADFNGDFFVTGDDFDEFVLAFESGDVTADADGNGVVNGDDFDFFAEHFIAGC